ncbi:MAG: hypothetical protein ACFFEF_05430 [Candidatus Thorarchaeota archaeon]
MSRGPADENISIRLRLARETVERIDELVGEAGRPRFIRESIEWRLDEELPPAVFELMTEMRLLKARVEYLEKLRDTDVFRGELNEVVKLRVCRDELDRKIISHILQHRGATSPDLAETLLGDKSKRRTILDRISKLNKRAETELGHEILRHEHGELEGKRGAWWAINPDELLS